MSEKVDKSTMEDVNSKKAQPEINKDRNIKDKWLRPRLAVQLFFSAVCVYIGWEFTSFVYNLRNDLPAEITQRPPGVEGFLPISSFMELWLYLKSGIAPAIHPAGVILFAFAIITAFLFKRGFCSWLCPIGTLSEFFTRMGIKIGINIKPNKWIDIPLRSLKYIVAAFFVYAILNMSTQSLYTFIMGDYNRASDIKMLEFFIRPSQFALSIMGILALLTLVIKNFWCRYLCPYGALLGLFSKFSPMAIRRDAETCIDCDKCDKVCPSYLPIATSAKVSSEECLGCLQCTVICPVKDCLEFSAPKKKFSMTPKKYAAIFVLFFLMTVLGARLGGYWQGNTEIEVFRELSKKSDILDHPRDVNSYRK